MTGFFLLWTAALAHAQEHLAPEYRGTKPPPGLLSTYTRFVKAARAGDSKVINSLVLSGASEVTNTPRSKNREYGTDINLPFLQNGFSPEIVGGGTQAPSEFSLRTATTAISFVKVESAGWRIYRYHDKPIE